MTIAVIDASDTGSGIGKLLAWEGIDVAIGHRDPAKAATLADHPLGLRPSMPAR